LYPVFATSLIEAAYIDVYGDVYGEEDNSNLARRCLSNIKRDSRRPKHFKSNKQNPYRILRENRKHVRRHETNRPNRLKRPQGSLPMKYVIDSYAWIEYFMGTEAGEKAKPIIESSEEKITPTICLAEVYAKTLKVESQELAERQRVFIKEKSALATLDEPIAVESAKVQTKMKKEIDGWGLVDSIVYATALLKKAEVVTGDEHFKKLKNVLFIK
jgi:predicted nucleic acid-binding protein